MLNLFLPHYLAFVFSAVQAQTLLVQPFLQDASPDAVVITWETDLEGESVVEWGLTTELGEISTGNQHPSNATNWVHDVRVEGLSRFTNYYYRVRTGNAVSEIFQFRTPPFASDHKPLRIVAMSDMQLDQSRPDKFREIVEEGVLRYLDNIPGNSVSDKVAFVMVPGDLVASGNNQSQWRNNFFLPARGLISYVPVYPVLGNHEQNTAFYYAYFNLPDNGSAGFEEHWWYKDHGNIRLIGLDSNPPFDNASQLNWLDQVLAETCEMDSIHFVFAQLHHPHKSELWTPGESDFTGDVITRLENFSSSCEKPSIHFFGHTHAYSRGQSRDHKHLWVNVATAGGAIDNWGEFPNFDYDEFSVSQDDYGFVIIETTNDDAPRVTIKRISRGDQDIIIDNVLTDSLTMRFATTQVQTPTGLFPVAGHEIAPECVVLRASAFGAEQVGSAHGQSHWQVALSDDAFSSPVAESWKNHENWYFEEDTQAGDDLTDEYIEGLLPNSAYWWRVRYRDKEMNWSVWSEPQHFETGASLALPNLINNSGAEADLSNWVILEGVVEALTDGVCAGISPHSGDKYFAVGGLCEHSPVGRAAQDVLVGEWADSIATGTFYVHFGAYLSNYSGSDRPEMKLLFLNEQGGEIAQSAVLTTLNNTWTLLRDSMPVPLLTSRIRMELKGTRNAGTDNDSYFDDIFLQLGTQRINCSPISKLRQPRDNQSVFQLDVSPNPMRESAQVAIPSFATGRLSLHITDAAGQKWDGFARREEDHFTIERKQLPAGIYIVWMRNELGVIGNCKLLIQ